MAEGTQYQQKYVCCNLCGSDNPKLLFNAHKLPNGKMGGIVRCCACGLVYRNLRQNDAHLRAHYEQREYLSLSQDWIAGRKKIFLNHIDSLEVFRQHNRILDVGAGHGFFLSMCAAKGWDCYGVEISKTAADFAKREFGLSLSRSSLEEVHYPDEFFDVVTFWNTLAHLPNPKRTLQETQRLLRPGGAVVVRCPNADFHVPVRKFLEYLRIRRKLKFIEPTVFHLYSFDKGTIARILKETGFTEARPANALLSWTTSHNAKGSKVFQITCVIVFQLAQLLYYLSFKRLVVGPSILVAARRS